MVENHSEFIEEVEEHCRELTAIAYGTLCLPELQGFKAEKHHVERKWDFALDDQSFEIRAKLTVYEASFNGMYAYDFKVDAATVDGKVANPDLVVELATYRFVFGDTKMDLEGFDLDAVQPAIENYIRRLLGLPEVVIQQRIAA